jgi:hypothetical protein
MYVYSAPDEPASVKNKVIRIPGGDKHVNIILVKTPSQDSSLQRIWLSKESMRKDLNIKKRVRTQEFPLNITKTLMSSSGTRKTSFNL